MSSPGENGGWIFDYDLMEGISVLGGDIFENPGAIWPSSSFPDTASLSAEIDGSGSSANPDGLKETGSKKRTRTGLCNANGSKACREKMRRDRLNDRLMELSALLDPGRPPKTDKSVILTDAKELVNQLRDEAHKLKESNESLQAKVIELKAEKNELRDEKQRLKTEKENMERQVSKRSTQTGFIPYPPAMAAPFQYPNPVIGGKPMPFVSYPGVPMYQFMHPAALDTSQDPNKYPPAA